MSTMHLIKEERTKVPMAQAATMLAELCERIDNGEEPTGALAAIFRETKLELREAIDRRIAFDTWIGGHIGAAKEARDEWDRRYKALQAARECFKENTKQIIEANPGFTYEGTLGKLAVQKSPAAVKYDFAALGYPNLDPDDLPKNLAVDIPPKYIRVTYWLDKAEVKKDLGDGTALPWAKLEQGTHLRIRK